MEPTAPPSAPEAGACPNCGAALHGPHCYRCGQPVKGLVRHFGSILGDFFDSVFDLDGRIWRTLPPLFALLLKLAYLFKRRLYMEHLIVALHSHAFLCLALLLSIVLDALSESASWLRWLGAAETALFVWMPLHLLLTQKRVYRQGWTMTLLKFFVIGMVYFSLLTTGVVFTILGGLVWL